MKSFAKINVFLKIIDKKPNYHQIISRFILINNFFDTLEFVKKPIPDKKFEIICNKNLPKQNTLTKVYEILCDFGFKKLMDEFLNDFYLIINKTIPIGAGLGGGSSNASTLLKMLNFNLNLNLSQNDLLDISSKVGADVSFFTSGFKSANIGGFGEIIQEFDDEIPNIEIITRDELFSTAEVFKRFRKFHKISDVEFSNSLCGLSSKEILLNFKNADLNDLIKPVCEIYNFELKDNEFLSGSGSSSFKLKDKR